MAARHALPAKRTVPRRASRNRCLIIMTDNSLSFPANCAEIRIKGKTAYVPSANIGGRTVIATGRFFKVASIRDADVVEGDLVENPEVFAAALKKSGLNADVLTFFQRPPEISPKFDLFFDWDNYAAVTISTFKNWWESVPQETRKNVRRAAKRGVATK